MSHADLGGDLPCWAHLFDDEDTATASTQESGPPVADLVRLDPGADIGSQVPQRPSSTGATRDQQAR
jgi:hypothetical protein